MISYSESFKIKWNYENWSCENGKGEDFFDFAAKLQYKQEKFEAAFNQHNCENKNDPWWTFIYYYSPRYR